jgi:membrane protein DedA with SNARE-associated domain
VPFATRRKGVVLFEIYIQPLIVNYGCWAVFFVVMLEAMGLPLPGESALVAAGIYAGATGKLSIETVVGSAAAGAIIGDNLGFWIGQWFGARLLGRFGKYVGLTENRLILGRYLFERHGGKIVFFGRFVAVLRVFAALLAGLNHYPWRSFLFYNAAGSITWAAVMGYAAYFFGDAINRVSGIVGLAGLGFAVAGIIAFWVVLNRQEKKFEARLTTQIVKNPENATTFDSLE